MTRLNSPVTPSERRPPMNPALKELLGLMDLEEIERNLFRGVSPKDSWQRVFGGQVIGQALQAATRTVPKDRPVHSLHAYFLRPGDPKVPIVYEVDRIRDGKSFTTRNVLAIQHGRPIYSMSVSFHVNEDGLAHQIEMPDVPPPEELKTELERRQEIAEKVPQLMDDHFTRPRPIETRPVNSQDFINPEPMEPNSAVWIKAADPLPDDSGLHKCLLAYASDMSLLDTCALPHGVSWFNDKLQMASLDHAMWFHRPFRADEWLLYVTDSPSSSGALGFNRGMFFNRDGVLVASCTQEGLIRVHEDKKKS